MPSRQSNLAVTTRSLDSGSNSRFEPIHCGSQQYRRLDNLRYCQTENCSDSSYSCRKLTMGSMREALRAGR
jgi:hypothetical protein